MFQISFNLFCSRANQCSIANEVDFRDLINVSPNIVAKNWNSKKLRHGFVDERALITTTLISSCRWKNHVPFCLRKCIFNTNSEFSQNRKEKQIMSSNTTINWLVNDILCYLFIACFNWKIGVFQHIVVRVYYILKITLLSSKCFFPVIRNCLVSFQFAFLPLII